MKSYDIFVLTTCLVVFLLLAVVFGVMLSQMVKGRLKLIRYGEYDADIKKEYAPARAKGNVGKILSYVINGVVSVFFIAVFVFSLVVNLSQNSFSANAPTMRVVLSDSMAKKLESNAHLFHNQLNDQFQTYDIILTYKVPEQSALELYDIVVYEVDEQLVVHRIVGIEEPNANHPDERWFTLQGDAVGNIDRFPVRYSQIRAVYRGEKVPFLGSFILFLQSPAGWLCLALIVGVSLLMPFVDNKVEKAEKARWTYLCEQEKIQALMQKRRFVPMARPIVLVPCYYAPPRGKGGQR